MEFKPFSYQEGTADFIVETPGAGVFLDMGMGKTVSTLTALERLAYDHLDVGKILVIAPKRPAEHTWPNEIEKWDHLRKFSYRVLDGTPADRKRKLEQDADIYIIGRALVPWLVDHYKAKWPFDTVVIDELSTFKSASSVGFRKLKAVRKYMTRVIGLTGTPRPQSLLDLWSQCYLLDEGQALGKTLTAFRNRYFVPDKRKGMVVYSWKPAYEEAEEEIMEKIKPFCMSLDSDDFLDLPERLIIDHNFDLSPGALATYLEFEKNTFMDLQEHSVDALTPGVLAGKLLQLAGGCIYDNDGVPIEIFDDKMQMLDELIEEANGEPVLVAYSFKHERDRILKRYPQAMEIKDPNAIDLWNQGKIPILLAHPASAGHGLNLQDGGHIIVWFSLNTSLELYLQFNKRLHRPGQKQPVLIHRIFANKTRDRWVSDVILGPKEEAQQKLLEFCKAQHIVLG